MQSRIELDGLTVPASSAGSLRSHPLLKDMLGARALVVRTLARLGVLDQEVRRIGPGPRKAKPPKQGNDDDADE